MGNSVPQGECGASEALDVIRVALVSNDEDAVLALLNRRPELLRARHAVSGETLLHVVARAGRFWLLVYLLEQWEESVDVEDMSGYTPLATACGVGAVSCALALISYGSSCACDAYPPIYALMRRFAHKEFVLETVQQLLLHGADGYALPVDRGPPRTPAQIQEWKEAYYRRRAIFGLQNTLSDRVVRAVHNFPVVVTLQTLCIRVCRRNRLIRDSGFPPLLFRMPDEWAWPQPGSFDPPLGDGAAERIRIGPLASTNACAVS